MTRAGLIIVAIATLTAPSIGLADNIRCKDIETVYDPIFAVTIKQIEAVGSDFKTLAKDATEQKRDVLRKRYCATGGEALGLYKAVAVQLATCIKSGEDLSKLSDVVKGQMDQTVAAVKNICG